MDFTNSGLALYVLLAFPAAFLLSLVVFLLMTFLPLLTSRERLHFLWDLEEYEYRKFRDFTDCTYFSEREFRVRVWAYHLLFGQRKYPKPTKEGDNHLPNNPSHIS